MRASWMPSIGDILFILLLQLLFVCLPNFIFGDGSTGWHLLTGHYILDQHQIPHKDIVSYTFPDKPWVAYEWLFDAFIALLDKLAGLRLVAVACCSAIAYLFLLLYQDCRKNGCHFMLSLVLCVTGALVSAIHWLARPHLVTFFAVFIFTHFLRKFSNGECSAKKLLTVLPLTMLVWVNCHPAFLMGLVILGIYLSAEIFSALCLSKSDAQHKSFSQCKTYALTLIACLLVSFINPYGIQLYAYITEYLHQSTVLAANDEFGSPVFHGQLQSILLELLYLSLIVGLTASTKKPRLGTLLTVLAYAHLSLAAKRNMPLFVIVSLPVIAEQLSQLNYKNALAFLLPRTSADSVHTAKAEQDNDTQPNTEAAAAAASVSALDQNTDIDSSNVSQDLEVVRLLEHKTHSTDLTQHKTNVETDVHGFASSPPAPQPAPLPAPLPTPSPAPSSWLQNLINLWNSTGQTIDSTEFLCTKHVLPILAVLVLTASCFNNGLALGIEMVKSRFDPLTKPTKTLDFIVENKLGQKRGFNYDNWGGLVAYKTGSKVFIDDRSDFYGEKFYLDYSQAATAQSNWQEVLDKYRIDWILIPINGVLVPQLKSSARWKLAAEDPAALLFERSSPDISTEHK